ncbi:MAG: hypothetical protein AAFX87_06715 [Bacteroidota bacterium]
MSTNRSIWLFSRPIDLLVLGLPVWLTWLACFLFKDDILQQSSPLWVWVVFVIGIDVSHVWSTIFRTYLDKEEFNHHKRVLILAPIISFVIFFAAANVSTNFFWTVLAYLAVYHFIKQQYGFLRLYQAKYGKVEYTKWFKDTRIIYLSMLYPVLYWHINSTRNFSWFVENDFFNFRSFLVDQKFLGEQGLYWINTIGNNIYWMLIIAWLVEEVVLTRRSNNRLAWGKMIWVVATAVNWYLGIVYFNSDFAFTITNVVAHGVPYMALIFFYVERKKAVKAPEHKIKVGSVLLNVLVMLTVVLILAFGEEYLWDMFLYRDNEPFFSGIVPYPFAVLESVHWQAIALALLSLPQVTHYILDGYIWKGNHKNPYLKKILFSS